MSQLERTKLLNLDRSRVNGASSSEFPFPRYICSLESQPGASCIQNASPDAESNPGCHWRAETCNHECPEKKLNPEFIKEVSLLYRTGGLPFDKKKWAYQKLFRN